MGNNWRELFPTKLTFIIFLLYMSLFIGQGIFVTASQEANNSYAYNTVTVVLLTEVLKLLVSTILYCRDNTFVSLLHDIKKHSNVLLLYCVPAFLYCLYNNLAFVNLATFDPTTYYLLLQLRVVITGVLFQIIFKKYLSRRQWMSLILLTCGCMLKQLNFSSFSDDSNSAALQQTSTTLTQQSIGGRSGDGVVDMAAGSIAASSSYSSTAALSSQMSGKNMSGFDLSLSALLILAQTIFSCLAGVYNEYLLKDKGSEVNIFVQNVFMYIDSIACNAVILLFRGELFDAFTVDNLRAIFRFQVLLIIVNNAAIGIVTSFFLKYMNSILKTFASALELLFTAVLCYFLFSIPIYMNTILAIAVVSFAIYLYTQSPVVNVGKVRPLTSMAEATQAKRKLLADDDDYDDDDDNDAAAKLNIV